MGERHSRPAEALRARRSQTMAGGLLTGGRAIAAGSQEHAQKLN
jgi:hypothetical protein